MPGTGRPRHPLRTRLLHFTWLGMASRDPGQGIPLMHKTFSGALRLASVAAVCGLGPIAKDLYTPREAVERISLLQRTLLLAEFLAKAVKDNTK